MPDPTVNVPGPSANGSQWTSGSGKPINAASPGPIAPPAPGPSLNPYVDPTSFGKVIIGNLTLPGVVEDIDGAGTPEEWAVQKGTGGNFATTIWRGSKLAESIKIKLALPTRAAFDGYNKARDTLRPKRGKKPPSLSIVNAVINWGGINRVGVKDPGFPKWDRGRGLWTAEIELIEYNPAKTAATGPADPAKPPGTPTPNDAAEAEAKKALDEANKA